MIAEFFAWIFTLLVVGPLQADINERLGQANLALGTVQQSQQCISAQAPQLVERASNDLWWATSTAIGITTGMTDPVTLIDLRDPNCAALAGLLGKQSNSDV